MALTTPKMVLKVWNLLTDPYDHDQLADNWAKVDQHDHTSSRGVQIPTEGIFDGAITSAKLATGLDPAPAFTAYKDLGRNSASFSGATAPGTYIFYDNGLAISPGGANSNVARYYDPADYAVASRTTYYRIRVAVLTNATAPASNFTVDLRPVATWGGGAGTPSPATIGGAIAGSPVTVTAPVAAGPTVATGTDFAAPVAGWYVLTMTNSATTAQPVQIFWQLQMRQV